MPGCMCGGPRTLSRRAGRRGCSTPRYLTIVSRLADLRKTGRVGDPCLSAWAGAHVIEKTNVAFGRPGSDLLSRVLRRSTIGAGAFHGRVRNGNGCSRPAITTRSAKRNIFEKLVEGFRPRLLFKHVVCLLCLHAVATFRSLRCRRRAASAATDYRPVLS